MSAYTWPIKMALILFPLLSLALVTPYMLQQYRKYGSISVFRSVVIFSLIYYLMNAYFMVILPLPERASVTAGYREMMQLRPFQFVLDLKDKWVLDITNPHTYMDALLQPVFTQVMFNILLTLPFGVYLRYYFKKDLKTTALYTLGLSLFFEVSQLSGLFFIYPGPYRLFDVDDLMLNTLGGVLGYVIAPFFMAFLPSKEHIDEQSYEKSDRVSLIKRALTYYVDFKIVQAIVILLTVVLSLENTFILEFVVFMLYFGLLPYVWNGQTLVMKFLKMKLMDEDGSELSLSSSLLRALLVFLFVSRGPDTLNFMGNLVILGESRLFAIFYLAILFAWFVWMLIYTIYVVVKRPHRLFYDRLAKVRLISIFK